MCFDRRHASGGFQSPSGRCCLCLELGHGQVIFLFSGLGCFLSSLQTIPFPDMLKKIVMQPGQVFLKANHIFGGQAPVLCHGNKINVHMRRAFVHVHRSSYHIFTAVPVAKKCIGRIKKIHCLSWCECIKKTGGRSFEDLTHFDSIFADRLSVLSFRPQDFTDPLMVWQLIQVSLFARELPVVLRPGKVDIRIGIGMVTFSFVVYLCAADRARGHFSNSYDAVTHMRSFSFQNSSRHSLPIALASRISVLSVMAATLAVLSSHMSTSAISFCVVISSIMASISFSSHEFSSRDSVILSLILFSFFFCVALSGCRRRHTS